jgi:probable F420-dependent oxidoreductase
VRVETQLPLGKVDPGIRAGEVRLDVTTVGEQARVAEELGYDGIALTETKDDPFVTLGLAAATTSRIGVVSAVAIAFPRSPTITAMSAWTLARLSGGRFTLGLGTQVKGHIERRYGVPWSAPGPWIREYVQAVRAVWRTWQEGVPLEHHGEHYDLTLMNPLFDPGPIDHPDIPVQLAAVGAGMARIAGEVADGVRPHPICTRAYLQEVLRPAVDAGAERAGRDPARVEVVASPLIVTAPTAEELAARVSDVRARISFYASTRTYRPVFAHHGWDGVAAELSELSRARRWDEMEALVTDEMVETIAVVGTYDEIAERVWRRYAGVCSAVEFGLPVGDGPDDLGRAATAVAALHRGF